MLLLLVVNAAQPVQGDLDRAKHRREERALAIEDARHIPAERRHDRDDDRAKKENLNPADNSHGITPLGSSLPDEKADEVDEQRRRRKKRDENFAGSH